MIKALSANRNPFHFKDPKHLKQQMINLQRILRTNSDIVHCWLKFPRSDIDFEMIVCFISLSCLSQKHTHLQVIWGESGNHKGKATLIISTLCMWFENAKNPDFISGFADQDEPDTINRRYRRGFWIHTRRKASGWTARGNVSTRSKTALRIHPQTLPSSFFFPPVPLLSFHCGTSA